MGEKHGDGVYKTHDGETYVGQFNMNLKEGIEYGFTFFRDWSTYLSRWRYFQRIILLE